MVLACLQHFLIDMDSLLLPIVLAAVVILISFVYYSIKNRGVVPGPIGVPYLGLYPFLTEENYFLKLEEYKKKYGDIFSFTYTGKLYINLGSIKAMHELILKKSDSFLDKSQDTTIMFEMLQNGISFENGKPWKILRKFFITQLVEYGVNSVRQNRTGSSYDLLNTTIEELKKMNGKPVNIVEFLGQRSAETIFKINFGNKCVSADTIQKMISAYLNTFENTFGANFLLIGPVARLLLSLKPSYRKKMFYYKIFKNLVLDCIRKIETSMDEEQPTCVIEEFYKERNKRRRENDPTWRFFTDEALVKTLTQFIGDGDQVVSSFISGILNVLLDYPDEQEKMYFEILEIIGPNRQPVVEDKLNLPYVNACIYESIRYANMLNIFPTVECTSETTYRGFRIPVGSLLIYNFRSAHHDPDTFEDPHIFNPSRYIPTSGKRKAEYPLIFGIGKRTCIAEPFGMQQAFLFVTTIVKNFKIVASNAPKNCAANFLMAGKLELTFIPRTTNI